MDIPSSTQPSSTPTSVPAITPTADAVDFWSDTALHPGRDWQPTTLGPHTETPVHTPEPFYLHAPPTPSSRCDARLPRTQTDRLQRTQIMRRTEYGMMERDIIRTMTEQTGPPEHRLFESVLRDPRDNRRFYLTNGTSNVT